VFHDGELVAANAGEVVRTTTEVLRVVEAGGIFSEDDGDEAEMAAQQCIQQQRVTTSLMRTKSLEQPLMQGLEIYIY
jgi:uncharacterized glyoxalase superfamily metalloenzyme YdcJ